MEGLFFLIFFIVAGFILLQIVRSFAQWISNNNAPLISVSAQIVKKEESSDTTMVPVGTDGAMMPMSGTAYTLWFRTETGEEKKYSVSRKVYNNANHGDVGTLQFKGTRFIAFNPQ
ncbi:MAG: DUF2500 domain-containing protein [Oscillospiraceae bacterium]|nr:DUF2500 domain-containing protein [Oscillospiraceae bacterium]